MIVNFFLKYSLISINTIKHLFANVTSGALIEKTFLTYLQGSTLLDQPGIGYLNVLIHTFTRCFMLSLEQLYVLVHVYITVVL